MNKKIEIQNFVNLNFKLWLPPSASGGVLVNKLDFPPIQTDIIEKQ